MYSDSRPIIGPEQIAAREKKENKKNLQATHMMLLSHLLRTLDTVPKVVAPIGLSLHVHPPKRLKKKRMNKVQLATLTASYCIVIYYL